MKKRPDNSVTVWKLAEMVESLRGKEYLEASAIAIKKVRDSQDGLIIQRNLALFFSGGDRQELKLKVAGRIWKE